MPPEADGTPHSLPGNWVVRLPTWLGDTVMALPAIRALQRAVTGSLTLWGPQPYVTLLQAAGIGDGRIAYRRRRGMAGIRDAAHAVRALARLHLDGALILPNAFEAALLSALARIPIRVGYNTEGRSGLLTAAVPQRSWLLAAHDADRYAELLAPLGVAPPRPADVLLPTPPMALAADDAIVIERRPLIGIVPGSANDPAKQWPPAYYGALASAAARRWDARPLLLGSAGDAAITAAVEATCDVGCLGLADASGILSLAAALSRCRAVVANDTGAAHLAAALGRPTLVLFGPTDPHRSCARGPAVQIASAGVFCQPCRASVCPLDHRCMIRLTPDRVMDALASLWWSSAALQPPPQRVDGS